MSKEYERKPLFTGAGFLDPNSEKPDLPLEMNHLWKQYEATGEVECLAKAAELAPFFGNPEMGKAIAKHLRDKRPSDKLSNEIHWRYMELFHEVLQSKGFKESEIYELLANERGQDPQDFKRQLMRRRKENKV